jgi:electron transport complex protein RnfG
MHSFKSNHRQKIAYHSALVGGFALLTSALLSIADRFTREDIAMRLAEDLEAYLAQVIPVPYDNHLLEDTLKLPAPDGKEVLVYRARHRGQVQALAYKLGGAGYGGSTIVLVMGVDPAGKILGVRVVSHAETPGLGDKIELSRSNWILSFNGCSLSNPQPGGWAVKKDGGVFDQFTGATITPRSVVKTVKGGLEFFASHRRELLDEQNLVQELPLSPATGSLTTESARLSADAQATNQPQ